MWQNLKIVELASVLAGPLVGSFFSELGAKVIKVENKNTGGDVTRQWKLTSEDKDASVSAYYASANYKKEVVFLDLKDEEDLKEVNKLILEADIVLQNFKSASAKKLKLDSKSLLKLKPELIVGSISGFGERNNRPAFDVILQAETGFMFMNGNKESGPIKMPVALIDILAAHHLKEAILIALVEKGITGKGKAVQVSLQGAAIASLANQASNFLMEGHVPQPLGTEHPNIAPYGDMYHCLDHKNLVLAIGNDRQFEKLMIVLELKRKSHLKYSSNQNRLNNRNEMNQLINSKIKNESSSHWKQLFLDNDIPFGIVKNLKEVFDSKEVKKLILKQKIGTKNCSSVKTLIT